jgi:phytanoyl-CoA dioxygenase PhyH
MDSAHFQSDPAGLMCGIWVALEDMDMDNGPLFYYPGSHKLPLPTWDEVEGEMGETLKEEDYGSRNDFMRARNKQYEQYCQRLVERQGIEPEYGTIKKGQAVLWAPNLLHGGSPQRDSSRTRHSQVTHYFFEGCRVYTPMHSEGRHNYWTYPEWIRDPVPVYSPEMLAETVAEHVPAGSAAGFFSAGGELPAVEGRSISHFPHDGDGNFRPGMQDGDEAIQALESARSDGVDFLVIPKEHLVYLAYGLPALQEHLEDRSRPVLRDGAVCAIYALG